MGNYIRPRGTLDLFDADAQIFSYINKTASEVAKKYNYKPIYTPTFEQTSLFARSTGETSDIVTKEMYTFKDKGDREITLRPEGTAGVIRAIIENKLYAINDLPVKYYYSGSFFRYERPQVGRYREFSQFGVEIVGSNSYLDDCELILFISSLLKELKINDYVIRINTFGDLNCRNNYRDSVKEFFKPHISSLCEDCQKRFNNNPLRILDCKIDKEYLQTLSIPQTQDSLDEKNKNEFTKIKEILKDNDIPFKEDPYLVRGLDYYTGLIFEVDITLKDGKVLTIGGGGRYSCLVKELGGPDLNCVGFAVGINRIALYLKELYGKENYENKVDYYIMPFIEQATKKATAIAKILREKNYVVVVENGKRSVGSMFKYASKNNFSKAIMIGEDELKENKLKVKDLKTQEQIYVTLEDLLKGSE